MTGARFFRKSRDSAWFRQLWRNSGSAARVGPICRRVTQIVKTMLDADAAPLYHHIDKLNNHPVLLFVFLIIPMHLRFVEIFCDVAQRRSFSKGAELHQV